MYRFKAETWKQLGAQPAWLAQVCSTPPCKGLQNPRTTVAARTVIIRLQMASRAKSHFSFPALQPEPRKCWVTPIGAPGEASFVPEANKRNRTSKSIHFREEYFKCRRKEEKIFYGMKESLQMRTVSVIHKDKQACQMQQKGGFFDVSPPTPPGPTIYRIL